MDVTEAYESTGLGAMDVTKPYKSIGFETMEATKPYKFIGFEANKKAVTVFVQEPSPPPP